MTKRKKNPLTEPEFIDELGAYASVVAEAVAESDLGAEEFLEAIDEACEDDDNEELEVAWYVGWLTCAASLLKSSVEEILAEVEDEEEEDEDGDEDDSEEDEDDDEEE